MPNNSPNDASLWACECLMAELDRGGMPQCDSLVCCVPRVGVEEQQVVEQVDRKWVRTDIHLLRNSASAKPCRVQPTVDYSVGRTVHCAAINNCGLSRDFRPAQRTVTVQRELFADWTHGRLRQMQSREQKGQTERTRKFVRGFSGSVRRNFLAFSEQKCISGSVGLPDPPHTAQSQCATRNTRRCNTGSL